MSKILMPTDGKWYEPLNKTMPQSVRWLTSKDEEAAVMDFQPGNGTRYVLSFMQLPGGEASDAMGARHDSQYMMVLHNIGTRQAVFVGPNTQYYDLNEKLGVGNADCLALCCLVRWLCGDMSNLTFEGGVGQ